MSEQLPARMVFTIQKEAAQRLLAQPGSKNYAAVSVFCESICDSRILFTIEAGAFWPQPKVESVVIELTPRQPEFSATQRREYWHFLQSIFSSRRKMLPNALRAWLGKAGRQDFNQAFPALGIERDVRAESLSPDTLVSLFRFLSRMRTCNAR